GWNATLWGSASSWVSARWIDPNQSLPDERHQRLPVLDLAGPAMLFCFVGGASFPGVAAPRFGGCPTEGYIAFASFSGQRGQIQQRGEPWANRLTLAGITRSALRLLGRSQ